MKVEKCPLCKQAPKHYKNPISTYDEFFCQCGYPNIATGITFNQAARRWNRWARREARKIERNK